MQEERLNRRKDLEYAGSVASLDHSRGLSFLQTLNCRQIMMMLWKLESMMNLSLILLDLWMPGYEGEDSSADEVDVNSSGSLTKNDDIGIKDDGQGDANVVNMLSNTMAEENCIPSDVGYNLKCKLGFKCRLCPRIVCMTEETLKAHLKSKRHARSEILPNKGRLRLIRNSDGEVEGEVNAGAERRARIAAAALVPANSRKEKEVRQKQRNRLKKKKGEDANLDKASLSAKHPAKKRLKFEN